MSIAPAKVGRLRLGPRSAGLLLTPAEFDRDRRRDAELMAKGYVVLRVSEQWLETDPAGVADAVYSLVTSGSIASSE